MVYEQYGFLYQFFMAKIVDISFDNKHEIQELTSEI